jgi:hypothetical protein
MQPEDIDLPALRALIGRETRHGLQRCRVIEVLEDGPALVLACADDTTEIQPNQHGEANRRVPKTVTVPVLTPERDAFDPTFLALLQTMPHE